MSCEYLYVNVQYKNVDWSCELYLWYLQLTKVLSTDAMEWGQANRVGDRVDRV